MKDLNQYSGYSNRETEIAASWLKNDLLCEKRMRPRIIELLGAATEEGRTALTGELKEAFASQSASVEVHSIVDWREIVYRLWEENRHYFVESGHAAPFSRSQAIADGALVDVTEVAKSAGFKLPVALTCFAWNACVAVTSATRCPDEKAQALEVLSQLLPLINARRLGGRFTYRFLVSVRVDELTIRDVELKSIFTPGDDGEPVITIKLPNEF